jgi:nucleotide-binding universal stress UspA family protein
MSLNIQSVKKILIATDGSDYSIRAAELGISMAKLLGAEVTVLYVIDTVVLDQIARVTEREEAEKDLKEDGQRYVSYIVELAQKEGVKAASIVAKGRPHEQISHLAKGLGINLIVIGTYGRTGAERILIGSVAARVIEYANCPVLVVK